MAKGYSAVVFDMDGVLADSEPVYNAAMQSVLTPLGHTITDRHQRDMMGTSIEHTWRYLVGTFAIEGPLDTLIDAGRGQGQTVTYRHTDRLDLDHLSRGQSAPGATLQAKGTL